MVRFVRLLGRQVPARSLFLKRNANLLYQDDLFDLNGLFLCLRFWGIFGIVGCCFGCLYKKELRHVQKLVLDPPHGIHLYSRVLPNYYNQIQAQPPILASLPPSSWILQFSKIYPTSPHSLIIELFRDSFTLSANIFSINHFQLSRVKRENERVRKLPLRALLPGQPPLHRSPGIPPRPPRSPAAAVSGFPSPKAPHREGVDITLNININVQSSSDSLTRPPPQPLANPEWNAPCGTREPQHILQPRMHYISSESLPRQAHSTSLSGRSRGLPAQSPDSSKYTVQVLPAPTPSSSTRKQISVSLGKASSTHTNKTATTAQTKPVAKGAAEKTHQNRIEPTDKGSSVKMQVTSQTESSGHVRVNTQQASTYVSNMRMLKQEIISCVICKSKFRVSDGKLHADFHRKQIGSVKSHTTTAKTGAPSTSVETDGRSFPDIPNPNIIRQTRRRQVRALFQQQQQQRNSRPNVIVAQSSTPKQVQIRRVVSIDDMELVGCQAFRPQSMRVPSVRPPSFLGPYFSSNSIPSKIPGLPYQPATHDLQVQTSRGESSFQEQSSESRSQKAKFD